MFRNFIRILIINVALLLNGSEKNESNNVATKTNLKN